MDGLMAANFQDVRPVQAVTPADPSVLPHGTRFVIAGCGRQDDGSAVPSPVCATLRAGNWRIDDQFTPGLGGRKLAVSVTAKDCGFE